MFGAQVTFFSPQCCQGCTDSSLEVYDALCAPFQLCAGPEGDYRDGWIEIRGTDALHTPLERLNHLFTSLSCFVVTNPRDITVFMSPHFTDEKPEAKRIDQNATGRSQEKSVCSHTFNSQAAQLGQKHGQQDAHKTSKPCWVSGVGRDAIDEVLEESREKKGLRPSPFEEDLWGLC